MIRRRHRRWFWISALLAMGCGVFGTGQPGDPTTDPDNPCAKLGADYVLYHPCGDGTCCPNDFICGVPPGNECPADSCCADPGSGGDPQPPDWDAVKRRIVKKTAIAGGGT